MSKVIMNSKQYIERLKIIADRKTKYINKYPYNLLYIHTDGYTSGDCLNTIKALLNGYNVYNNTPGYYQRDLSNTQDINEPTLLSKCTEISSDFTNIPEASLLYMRGRVGSYIGPCTRNGCEYNVIECTKAWGGGVLYSWVDADGTRRNKKGGLKNGKWVSHGRMTKWIDYNATGHLSDPIPLPVDDKSKSKVVDYTVVKGDTLSAIARRNGLTLKQILELNPDITNPNLIRIGQKIRIK